MGVVGVVGVMAAAWVSSSWPSRVASAVEPSRLAESLRKLRRLWVILSEWSGVSGVRQERV